jgi:hypothetical protein
VSWTTRHQKDIPSRARATMSSDDNPFEDASISGAASAAPPPPDDSQPSWMNAAASPVHTDPAPPPAGDPQWLSDPKPPGAPLADQAGGYPDVPGGPPPMDISLMQLPRPVLAMRLSNVVAAFFLALVATIKLMEMTAGISTGVICIYLFLFGLLLFTFELHCSCTAKMIASNLGFMYRATGRMCFMVLVGMLCFSGLHALGVFTGVFLIVAAFYNGFILFKYPMYEKSCRIVDLGE